MPPTATLTALEADVFLHAADRAFVTHPHPRLRLRDGERQPHFGGVELMRASNHFAGGTLLHWTAGADGRGVLLNGDIGDPGPPLRGVTATPT